MTVSPLVATLVVALIILLAFLALCFALAWLRTEAELELMRRHRLNRVTGMPSLEHR